MSQAVLEKEKPKRIEFIKYEPNEETKQALDEFQKWLYTGEIDPDNEYDSFEDVIKDVLDD